MSFLELFLAATTVGVGATLFMDLAGLLQRRLFSIPMLDYALVGRWAIWTLKGQFRHQTILQSAPQPFERSFGWVLHYLIGIVFVATMLVVTGPQWISAPTASIAILTGIITVLVPFLIMQPVLGFGVAASNTPKPWQARARSLVSHTYFGVGIYLAAVCVSFLSG